jgi:hypothetical protein
MIQPEALARTRQQLIEKIRMAVELSTGAPGKHSMSSTSRATIYIVLG